MLKELNKKRMKKYGIEPLNCSQIEILEETNPDAYFWFMPSKILDYSNTDDVDNVEARQDKVICIEEDWFWSLLFKYVNYYFNSDLPANINRDDVGLERYRYYGDSLFKWNLTYNFFTFEQIEKILRDIKADIWEFNDVVKDFYFRFINYMEKMIEWSKDNEYPLIIIQGP